MVRRTPCIWPDMRQKGLLFNMLLKKYHKFTRNKGLRARSRKKVLDSMCLGIFKKEKLTFNQLVKMIMQEHKKSRRQAYRDAHLLIFEIFMLQRSEEHDHSRYSQLIMVDEEEKGGP